MRSAQYHMDQDGVITQFAEVGNNYTAGTHPNPLENRLNARKAPEMTLPHIRIEEVDGERWFSLLDICSAFGLEIENVAKRLRKRGLEIRNLHPGRDIQERPIRHVDIAGLVSTADATYHSPARAEGAKALGAWIKDSGFLPPSVPQQTIVTSTPNAQKEHPMATANTVHPSTNNATQIFDFEGQNVRTVTIDNEPWFVLGDVMNVLDIKGSTTDVKKRLDQDGVDTIDTTDSIGRKVKAAIINESGLYDVILDSRKPQAKAFRRWITSEVIPSIRKHGGYLTEEKLGQALLDPDVLIQLAQNLKDEQTKRKQVEAEKEAILIKGRKQGKENRAKIEALSPKAEAFDKWINGEGVYMMATAAKILDQGKDELGQNRLFKFLREEGILISSGPRRNTPYQSKTGYFRVKTVNWTNFSGEIKSASTTYVTAKGIDFIAKRLRDAGYDV